MGFDHWSDIVVGLPLSEVKDQMEDYDDYGAVEEWAWKRDGIDPEWHDVQNIYWDYDTTSELVGFVICSTSQYREIDGLFSQTEHHIESKKESFRKLFGKEPHVYLTSIVSF